MTVRTKSAEFEISDEMASSRKIESCPEVEKARENNPTESRE
jgi:hypothetical protein